MSATEYFKDLRENYKEVITCLPKVNKLIYDNCHDFYLRYNMLRITLKECLYEEKQFEEMTKDELTELEQRILNLFEENGLI